MGNSWACFAPEVKEVTLTRKTSKRLPNSSRKSRTSTSTPTMDIGMLNDDAFIQQQALAAALLFRQHQQNLSLPLARSTSVVYPSPGPKKLPKSSSSRQRSSSDSLIHTYQLVKQVCVNFSRFWDWFVFFLISLMFDLDDSRLWFLDDLHLCLCFLLLQDYVFLCQNGIL